jgi:hypothetical protein
MNKNELIPTIALVLGLTIFFTIKSKKDKDSSWKGELVKKKTISDEDDENHVYRLIFKTTDGKTKKASVGEDFYNQVQIGDKFEKLKGEYTPKKILG